MILSLLFILCAALPPHQPFRVSSLFILCAALPPHQPFRVSTLFILCAALPPHQPFRVSSYQLIASSIPGSVANDPPFGFRIVLAFSGPTFVNDPSFRHTYHTSILGSKFSCTIPLFGLLIARIFPGSTLVVPSPFRLTCGISSQNRGSFAELFLRLPFSLHHMHDGNVSLFVFAKRP